MTSENAKTRSKCFSKDEVMTLVDLICVEKSSLFGALSTTLTFDDKNKVWEDIAGKFSEQHGQMRTKDDVSKKWYNILSKHTLASQVHPSCGPPPRIFPSSSFQIPPFYPPSND